MRFSIAVALFVSLLNFVSYAVESEILDDVKLLVEIQKTLKEAGLTVQERIPALIYYIGQPPHFHPTWAGLTTIRPDGTGKIEIRLTGDKEEDMDTFFHECFHWFVLDVKLPGFENRAIKFAKACRKEYKGKITQGLQDIWYGRLPK